MIESVIQTDFVSETEISFDSMSDSFFMGLNTIGYNYNDCQIYFLDAGDDTWADNAYKIVHPDGSYDIFNLYDNGAKKR